MRNFSLKNRGKRIVKLGGLAGVLALILALIPILQTERDTRSDSAEDATSIALQQEQLQVLQELATLQTSTGVPGLNTATPTLTMTPILTPSPTPDALARITELIEKEKIAVLTTNQELIDEIFTPDATKTDASKLTPQVLNARARYKETFKSEEHREINHPNLKIEINGDEATATNDSCGRFFDKTQNQEISYSSPQGDRWTFARDGNGRWWITDLTFGIQSTNQHHLYGFEDETHGCWRVRIDNNEPQGDLPKYTTDRAYEGSGSLHFPFNLAEISSRRAQVIQENMPFGGHAAAFVYALPDAPVDLEAGFFAMELDRDPWNYQEPTELIPLTPGQWTRITWDVDVSNWEQPVHLLGIEIHRMSGEGYEGYVLIDNVSIVSR